MKPILKWAGGKRQLLPVIKQNLPLKMDGSYYEPFFGGGALFFEIAPRKAYLNDLNEDLVKLYNLFFNQKEVEELKRLLNKHQKNHSKEYYYFVRSQDQAKNFLSLSPLKKAARLIYLNKACFNGLYRVNSGGYFNVPFNQSKNVTLFDENNFNEIQGFFANNNLKFTAQNYYDALKGIKKGDFVYFDPPYDELENKNSFTSYSKFGFNRENQVELANLYKQLTKKGVHCLLSNHETDFVKSLYSEFNIVRVKALRMINSKVDGRKAIYEVLIKNY